MKRRETDWDLAAALAAVPVAALLGGTSAALGGLSGAGAWLALALPLLAAWRAGQRLRLAGRARGALAVGAAGVAGLAGLVAGPALVPVIAAGVALLVAVGGWTLAGWRSESRRLAGGVLAAGAVATVLAAMVLGLGDTGQRRVVTDEQPHPLMFIPLELDPSGSRLLCFSLRDSDPAEDEDRFSLWGIDVNSGTAQRAYRGYPFLTADWCPAGNQIAFAASDRAWWDEPQPFGVRAARADGTQQRSLLPPPTENKTWMLPLWSRRGDMVGAWLLAGSQGGPEQLDLPESWAVSADGGAPRKLEVPRARISLLGAWQADGLGAYMMTDNGIHLLDLDSGEAKRLVPGSEGPLEPFPFAIPQGVRPSGDHLAWLDVHFKRGALDRIDLGLVNAKGHRTILVKDLVPMAFGWSPDGRYLAAARLGRHDEIVLQVLDFEERERHTVRTGLKLASKDLVVRLTFSRDGRYLGLDGQFTSEEQWDVAVCDWREQESKKFDAVANHLAVGWRPDGKLIVSDLGSVSVINPDGSGLREIYPGSGGSSPASVRQLGSAARTLAGDALRGLDMAARLHQAGR